MTNIGFIILRHVNNELTNKYWNHCYECIRKYYPENMILIIDDNSDNKYVVENQSLYKTVLINGEYPGRGELLPYYYYLHNKLFDTAVILHDSVFINTYIDFSVEKYKMLWDFDHLYDHQEEKDIINIFNDEELHNFHKDTNLWRGCFGGMTSIRHDYLKLVNESYDISKLLEKIKTRHNRCSFERIISCLLKSCLLQKNNYNPFFGNILGYCNWGLSFEDQKDWKHLPVIKVWTGR